MKTRLSRLVGAMAVIVAGMVAVRLSRTRELPAQHGTWEPVDELSSTP